MTTAQFIASIEAKPNFIKWAKTPSVLETVGDVEKHHGIAYINTGDGTNTYNVYFMVDTATGEATWQQQDTLQPDANADATKLNSLKNYLKTTFSAYFLGRVDLVNNWAEVDTYTLNTGKLQKKSVIVYKVGNNPITHLEVM